MVKEIKAREAKAVALDLVPKALLKEILTKIKEAATKGELKVVIDIGGYYENVWRDDLKIEAPVRLLQAKIKSLGYFCDVNPPSSIRNPYPEIAAWIEIEW